MKLMIFFQKAMQITPPIYFVHSVAKYLLSSNTIKDSNEIAVTCDRTLTLMI